MNELTKKAKDILDNVGGFIKNNNYSVVYVEEGYCELKGLVNKNSLNHIGIAHGGYVFGLIDTASGIAAMSKMQNAVTLNSNINFIKQAKEGEILAKAKVLNEGKKTCVVDVKVFDSKEVLLASATVTFYYLNKQL